MNLVKYLGLLFTMLPSMLMAQMNIQIENAYIRELPPSAETAAVYMAISNVGQHPLSLTEVRTDAARSAMIHLSSTRNGMMVMEHLSSIDLPPQQSVVFEPGSFHIMLEGLRQSLVAGDSIRLLLGFSNGMVISATVPVISTGN